MTMRRTRTGGDADAKNTDRELEKWLTRTPITQNVKSPDNRKQKGVVNWREHIAGAKGTDAKIPM